MDNGVQGIEPLLAKLIGMAARARNPRPALFEAGEGMIRSIQKNIDVGGRPAFKPLADSTRLKNPGGSILNRSGDLRDSFTPNLRGFQFHIGSIKTTHHEVGVFADGWFQFHIGSIKTVGFKGRTFT